MIVIEDHLCALVKIIHLFDILTFVKVTHKNNTSLQILGKVKV